MTSPASGDDQLEILPVGFAAAPRVVGSGLDREGREILTFINGAFTQSGPWSTAGR